jgi:soluble epoxide hydrolase / lipid-phosphate phosphatase
MIFLRYKAMVKYGPSEEDKKLQPEEKQLKVPTLVVITEKDYVVIPDWQLKGTQQYAKDLEVARMDSAHWVMLEKRDEFESVLENFASKHS